MYVCMYVCKAKYLELGFSMLYCGDNKFVVMGAVFEDVSVKVGVICAVRRLAYALSYSF